MGGEVVEMGGEVVADEWAVLDKNQEGYIGSE